LTLVSIPLCALSPTKASRGFIVICCDIYIVLTSKVYFQAVAASTQAAAAKAAEQPDDSGGIYGSF
jgi:hypothetical protein